MLKLLDHSARHVWDECRRKYYWQYIIGLEQGRSVDLDRGSAVHKGLYEWYKTGSSAVALAAAKMERPEGLLASEAMLYDDTDMQIEQLLQGYFQRYADDDFEIISLERPLAAELPNGWMYIGVVDAVLRHKVLGLLNQENKSTKQIATDWVAKFQMDSQSTGYVWLAWANDLPVFGTLLSLLRMSKYPDYVRDVIKAEEWLVEEWHDEIITITQEMEYREGLATRTDPMAAYPKNTDACFKYNKECPFRKICLYGRDRSTIIESFYRKRSSPTREEKILQEAQDAVRNS